MAFVAVGAAHAAGNLAFCPDGPALLSRVEVPDAVAIHGFDQLKNIREYMFEDVVAGEAASHFVVSADLALFVKHHVGSQAGVYA